MNLAFAKTWKFWALLITVGVMLFIVAQAFSYFTRENKREEDANRNQGVQAERLEHNEEVINAVQNAQRPVTDNELERVRSRYDRSRRANSQ